LTKLTVAVVLIAALGLTACGPSAGNPQTQLETTQSAPSPAPELDKMEGLTVASFEYNASVIALAYLDGTTVDAETIQVFLTTKDKVIAIARTKPDAVYTTDKGERTMRQILGDNAATLLRSEPAISKELELAMETLPPRK